MEQQFNPHEEMHEDQVTAQLRLEQAVLGEILLEPGLMDEAAASIRREMFTSAYHRNLFRMISEMHNDRAQIDLVTIVARYDKHLDKIGGIVYLTKLCQSGITTANFGYYAGQLVESHARRKLLQLLDEYRPRIEDPSSGTFEEMLDEFEREALAVRPVRHRAESGVKDVVEWYEQLVLKSNDRTLAFGLMTGWAELDRMTLGWQRGDLIIVGARTSMGKSAFALENALRVSVRGWRVAIFSLEMSKGQIFNRMMSGLATVTMQAMRVGSVNPGQLEAISSRLSDVAKIHIDDERAVTAEYITSEMRRLKRDGGLDLVIVDYLQEIKEPTERNDNSGSALHRVAQKIRQAAKDCDCPVMALSQVKREVENRSNKRPMPSDLAGSTGLEAVADTTILLYRDEYYNPDTPDKGIIEVNVAKQRNGPTGLIKMRYDKDYQRITGKGDEPIGAQQLELA